MDGSETMSVRANENEVKNWKGHQRNEDAQKDGGMAQKDGVFANDEEAEKEVLAYEEGGEEEVLAYGRISRRG